MRPGEVGLVGLGDGGFVGFTVVDVRVDGVVVGDVESVGDCVGLLDGLSVGVADGVLLGVAEGVTVGVAVGGTVTFADGVATAAFVLGVM
ncbi:hypothetical protein [Kribbella sp. HUAS MG21]|uniref:Uncharacterized protein n=1 Tax=Kribbella sp. HUAS MG21 TaxID=3160966 RepID=A0AAU7TGR5_9ACTN